MSRIEGMYPGGPRRQGATSEPHGTLRSGEDVEARIIDDLVDAKARRKRRSIFIALGAFGLLAVTGGIYIGLQAHVTAEELVERERVEAEASDIDKTVQKVLDELWRMEELEAARNRR